MNINSLNTDSSRGIQLYPQYYMGTLDALHCGRTPAFDRRTFPVPRSTCRWRVMTTYVGKTSATVQSTRPTEPFILSGSINWVVSWSRCAPPCLGDAIWWMLTKWMQDGSFHSWTCDRVAGIKLCEPHAIYPSLAAGHCSLSVSVRHYRQTISFLHSPNDRAPDRIAELSFSMHQLWSFLSDLDGA